MKLLKIMTLLLAFYSTTAAGIGIFKNATNVASIEIIGLEKVAGMNLTAFYVSGRDAYFSTIGTVINVNKIMAQPVKVKIDASGKAVLPATKVHRSGFSVFNNVVFVVHKQANHYIQNYNARSKRPNDPRLPTLANGDSDWSNVLAEEFQFRRKVHRKSSKLKADGDGVIRLNFGY